jgi:hypothetical protein
MIQWWRRRRAIRRDRHALFILWACNTLGRATVGETMQVTGLGAYASDAALAAMERDGAVSREWDGTGAGRRCYYAVTEYGERQMRKLTAKLSRVGSASDAYRAEGGS